MAQLTITVPDEQVARIRAAFAPRLRKPVDEVVAEDIRLFLVQLLKDVVRTEEAAVAERQARDAVVEIDAT